MKDCDNEGTIDPDNSEDDWSEDETEIPAGVTDTMDVNIPIFRRR